MVITHVFVGLLLAVPVAVVAPAYATAAVVGAVVGGIAPDVDLFVGVHRRTLHFPVYGPVVGVLAGGIALLAPSTTTVGVALALLSAGVHSASDVLGAGEELRPWERTNPYAVYDHARGRWLRARYVIPYDGAPRDLLVSVLCAIPAALTFDGGVRWLIVGALAVAGGYTVVRKRVVPHFETLLD